MNSKQAESVSALKLVIITPIFFPTAGGASTYYRLLTQGLMTAGQVRQITVITEQHPGQPDAEFNETCGVEIIRVFPHRAGAQLSKLSQYLRYGLQNLQYFGLPRRIRSLNPDVVLVHSSLHNFFNLLTPALRQMARQLPLIADVRDHQLPRKRLHQLDIYDSIIACSANVLAHLGAREALKPKIHPIPVIQEDLGQRETAGVSLEKHGLEGIDYLLFAGLLKPDKGVSLLLSAYECLRARGRSEQLVLVGQAKDPELVERARQLPGVKWLGPLPREELLDLLSRARLAVNLSVSEGLPRSSLEAIALGAQVALPAGIPEFEQHCPDNVVRSQSPEIVAEDLNRLLESDRLPNYPVDDHRVERVCQTYADLLGDSRRDAG